MKTKKPAPGVVILYNDSDRLIKGEAHDILADQGVVACAHAIGDALRTTDADVVMLPISDEVEPALASYPPDQWLIFNLYEGLGGRLFDEARVAWALEAMGYRFTGCGGEALARSTNKAYAKSLLAAAGAPTPPWWLFRRPDDVDRLLLDEIQFPLIVKPVAEDASSGITENAIVHTISDLQERVAYVVDCYRQSALAEKFIVGREFNIAIWGDPPEVLPLAEIDFGAFDNPYSQIVSFAAKWEQDAFEYHHTPAICPAPVEPGLGQQITNLALQAWEIFDCKGYARVDMRVCQEQVPYILEVNCNPDISPEAGFHNAARVAGYNYKNMIEKIIETVSIQSDVYDRLSQTIRWPFRPANYSQHARIQPVRTGVRR
ncbi:MAG: hypothetical protein FJ010_14840 [Chloroflexi bacterium]|nr:hypothetical protein [Chloroflexota bacterium]